MSEIITVNLLKKEAIVATRELTIIAGQDLFPYHLVVYGGIFLHHSTKIKPLTFFKYLSQTLKGITVNPETKIPISNRKINLLISQFRRENESWRRTLGFLIEEDIILKAGISDILKNMTETNEGILKKLEQFHNRLMKENDTVRVLRTGVADMEKKLNQDFFVDTDFTNSITRVQRILRKQIETVEMEFLKLKFDFNEYIDGILQNGSQ